MLLKLERILYIIVAICLILSGCKEERTITPVQTPSKSTTEENVGSTYIAEVVYLPAETFNGNTVDDTSRPTSSYLPVGTVDYCSDASIVNSSIEKSYRLLRYGKRVYEENINVYEGILPQTNTLSLDRTGTEGKYTVLSFFTDWKAPFTLELKDQTYNNPSGGDWSVSEATFSYVEIKFMYCSELVGDISFGKDNPLFSHSEKITEDGSTILKLYLKKQGGFYGFKAEYDEYDCLVFKFLEPTRLYTAENEYGYALYDKTVIIDAGHGGRDPGAVSKSGVYESHMNLSFANLLKKELETVGATVIMTRSDDRELSPDQRIAKILEQEPDFLISVHRNSGSSSGYGTYYYNAFSAPASKYIHDSVWQSGMYRKTTNSRWHYFFLNRAGICPSVLTENGHMSDAQDVANMQNTEYETACAKATVKGIIDYFLSQEK